MKYSVIVQATAAADAEEIRAELEIQSPQYAARWIDELDATLINLAKFPNRFAYAPESARCTFSVRQVLIGRYRLLFAVRGNFVHVMRIRHAARLPFNPGELN
jgi:plasmid stabilization system protein ParE